MLACNYRQDFDAWPKSVCLDAKPGQDQCPYNPDNDLPSHEYMYNLNNETKLACDSLREMNYQGSQPTVV